MPACSLVAPTGSRLYRRWFIGALSVGCTCVTVLLALFVANAPAATKPAVAPYEIETAAVPKTAIDKLVNARLEKLHITAAKPCSDSVFVRRVYLDVIGTLPTFRETSEFLNSHDPNKRATLIDRLLARDEFADYWAMKWSDLLRVKAEFPVNLWPNAAQAYHHWLLEAMRNNMPYDRFVRELLTSNGSNFRVAQVNFFRAMQNREPDGIAQAVALSFMGVRAEKWPKEQLASMATFFSYICYKDTSEWKEQIIIFDPAKTNAPSIDTAKAVFPDGTTAKLSGETDPRVVFADWLITPQNRWFTRNIANRAWSWFLGRGIIHEPDDIRTDNPPTNPALLAYLEKEMVDSHYDLKQLFRLILNSRTYQLSSIPADDSSEAAANFARYPIRRLEAEVLADALCQITGSTEKYSSAIPEPYTFIPENVRSISLPDGSISSAFLELFGKPPRDTGLETERNSRPTAAQSLHLLNSTHIQKKLEDSRPLQNLIQSKSSSKDVVSGLYLMILSRYPTETEWNALSKHAESSGVKEREAMIDLAWALVNSAEFVCRH